MSTEETCKAPVFYGTWGRNRPCKRGAVKDGYCLQHHPESVVKRQAEHRCKEEERYAVMRAQLGLPNKLRTEIGILRYALEHTYMALSDYYIVHGKNPSAEYNTLQIMAEATDALDKTKP